MLKKAIVLVNIGTPEDLSVKAVRKYLGAFLMDKNVLGIPFLLRWFLVKCIILPFRGPKSLAAYKVVWTKKGSPLNVYTKEMVAEISSKYKDEYLVRYAMAYSNPYIGHTLDELKSLGVDEIFYIPMYPQYAQSSSLSALEAVESWVEKNPNVKVSTTPYYFDHPDFLKASVEKIKKYKDENSNETTRVLYSFHGIPEKQIKNIHAHCQNDKKCCQSWQESNEFCYRSQCFKTAAGISNKLGLANWEVSFQSRLGKAQWILPYTVVKVRELAKAGVKKLVVVPYAFTVDCLETEEEIENEIRDAFREAGGDDVVRVPCLNRDFANVVTKDFLASLRPLTFVMSEVRSHKN